MNLLPETPAGHAERTLFESIAPLLRRFDSSALPDVAELNRLLHDTAPGAATTSGKAVRFDSGAAPLEGYEARIHDTGLVPTRRNDWHDFFNALSWCVWPRTKAALNAAHVREINARRAAGLPGRGPRRDALTQFDECGLLVVSSDAEVLALLSAHEWEEVFWHQRDALADNTAFLLLGHGSWEQLRRPFVGLCAKTLQREVSADWFKQPQHGRQRDCDAWLAACIDADEVLSTPRTLRPLPLLGIPGVTSSNACAEYYRDTRQFRPARRQSA